MSDSDATNGRLQDRPAMPQEEAEISPPSADVAVVYLPEEEDDASETREAVEKEGRTCLLLPGDLNVLVSNAAYLNSQNELSDLTAEAFDRVFKTNVCGYFPPRRVLMFRFLASSYSWSLVGPWAPLCERCPPRWEADFGSRVEAFAGTDRACCTG